MRKATGSWNLEAKLSSDKKDSILSPRLTTWRIATDFGASLFPPATLGLKIGQSNCQIRKRHFCLAVGRPLA